MKPYYSNGRAAIYLGSWLAHPEIVGEADCIIADPPYGQTSLDWDKWPKGWPGILAEMSKPEISLWCFGSARLFIERATEFNQWKFIQDIVWQKHNGSNFANDRFRRIHELAYHFTKKRVPWSKIYKAPQFTADATARTVRRKERPPHLGVIANSTYVSTDGRPRLMRSIIQARSCHGHAVNETQRPVAIVKPLIAYSCPPSGTLVSLFMGSGTDLVAASELGIKSIGFELRESQCEAAAKRFESLCP